jgi:Tfp pilus assembly protein PilN
MRRLIWVVLSAAAAALALAGVQIVASYRAGAVAEADVAALRQELEAVRDVALAVETYERDKRRLEQKVHILERLRDDTPAWRLAEVERAVTASGLRVESLWIQAGLAEISVAGASSAAAARLGRALEESAVFADFDVRPGDGGRLTLSGRLAAGQGKASER